jgi:hypothetical protein
MGLAMAILMGIATFIWLRLTRARRREHLEIARTTGMIRSPLYHIYTVLLVTLLGRMLGAGYVHKAGGWLPLFFLGGIIANVAALLLVRRALKWRYPI